MYGVLRNTYCKTSSNSSSSWTAQHPLQHLDTLSSRSARRHPSINGDMAQQRHYLRESDTKNEMCNPHDETSIHSRFKNVESDDNRQHRIVVSPTVIDHNRADWHHSQHHTAINSSMGSSWRSCSSNTFRRTLRQNTSIGITWVKVNSRRWGASTKVA